MIANLDLKQHPDKTTIGKISQGFDFLGIQFYTTHLCPSKKTLHRLEAKLLRLYEQEPDAENRSVRQEQFIHRWQSWYKAITKSTIHIRTTRHESLFNSVKYLVL